MSTKRGQTCIALVVMALWGSLYPMVKLGYGPFDVSGVGDTMLFAGIRFAVCGGLIFLCCFVFRRGQMALLKENLLPVLMMGIFSVVIHYGLLYFGMTMTSGSKTSMLKQVGVLFYICLSSIFIPEDKLSWRKIAGALLGFVGIGMMSMDGGSLQITLGDGLIIGASFSIMFSNVISKKLLGKNLDPIMMTGCSQMAGGLIMITLGCSFGGNLQMPDFSGGCIMLYICAASIVSYLLWYSVLKRGQLSELFIIKFAEVVFSGIVSALVLGEHILRWEYACAVGLIAGGIVISNGTFHDKKQRSEAQ